MRRGIERYTGPHVSGSTVEREVLGTVDEEAYAERFKGAEYVPYREALKLVRESQPFDPTDPDPQFANDLHATVAEKLGLEDYSQLRFYTAVSNTHLDVFHGIDAFFEFQYGDDTDEMVTATIDITTRPKESYKADVLIIVPDEGFDFKDPEDKKKCTQVIEAAAKELVRILYAKVDRESAEKIRA